MGDDLSNFIESQKKKLERERIEVQSRTEENLKGNENSQSKTPSKAQEKQTKESEIENIGLQLGGYEKVQQKLRQERKDEYRKFLAEKNMRSSGKIDKLLSENDKSSIPSGLLKEKFQQSDRSTTSNSILPSHSRRRDKENIDIEDSPSNKDYYRNQDLLRGPENLFERYEDILRRKRAEERQYRGRYDDPELNPDIRSMKLKTPNYKFNSRSDGYLSRRYDDSDEIDYDLRRSKRRNWDDSQRRVRFDDELDLDDSWLRRESRLRRRLMVDDLDDDDDDLLDWVRRRGRRGQRRNSAHEERRKPEPEQPQVVRSQTDSNIRSQSAPLMDGKGLFGGSDDSRITKAKKQEQYKKELQAQMKEQEEMKRRERRARFGGDGQIDQSIGTSQVPDNIFIQRDEYKDTGQPPVLPQEQVTSYGPSSRLPPQPTLHTSLYDDPLYYYGNFEMGAPNGPSGEVPLLRGAQFASAAVPGVTVGGPSRAARVSEPVATSENQTLHTSTLVSNPPGGQTSFGFSPNAMAGKGGSDTEAAVKKRAAQQAYQEELKRQMAEKDRRKKKEKEDQERYEMKKEEEIRNYNPWGKGGGGAPIRDTSGQLITNLNLMHKINQEGKVVSPRDAPQAPMEKNFETNLDLSPVIDVPVASNVGSNSEQFSDVPPKHDVVAKSSPFGRSDPLKETQPGDEMKRTAKAEYQEYLKQQVLEKERKRKEEQERRKREEELEEKRLQDQRRKMQEEFEKEQEAKKRKEEETRKKNAEMQAAQEAKKLEAERRKKEMEEKRQAELKKKLDKEMASKRTSTYQETRTSSPPIPTIRKQLENEAGNIQRMESPPVPAMANKQRQDTKPVSPPRYTDPDPSVLQEQEQDILSQLTALRQQLKNEENKIKSQINRTNVQRKYSNSKVTAVPVHPKREDTESRRSRRDVNAFERAMAHKGSSTNKDPQNFSAAEEFNRMKYEETSSLAGEFRSRFPQPATTNSTLDLQQQAYLREQEDKLASLRSDYQPAAVPSISNNNLQAPSRSGSKTSLLESESQFIAVDDATDPPPVEKMTHTQSRHSTARERRRWKQLEEMAKNPKPYESYKPPTPGGFSLNSVTSFNVDNVAQMNEERLRRLEAIRKDGESEKGDPDQVLKRFMNRPLTRASEESLEAETFYRPIN